MSDLGDKVDDVKEEVEGWVDKAKAWFLSAPWWVGLAVGGAGGFVLGLVLGGAG